MVQTDAQRRAKAKYYAKFKENEEYKAQMTQRSRDCYQKSKAKNNETVTNTMKRKKQRLIIISRRREKVTKSNLLFLK